MNLVYKMIIVSLLALVPAILSINIGLTHNFVKGTVEINHPIINKPFESAKSAAGYFTIKNHGPKKISLRGVSMTLAKAMLHETTTDDDGVVRMKHVMKVDIPPDGELILKPGSFHVMIMGINRPLLLNDEIPATLLLDTNLDIDIVFKVKNTFPVTGSKKKTHTH